jgi:hypothetical protein
VSRCIVCKRLLTETEAACAARYCDVPPGSPTVCSMECKATYLSGPNCLSEADTIRPCEVCGHACTINGGIKLCDGCRSRAGDLERLAKDRPA